MMGQKLIPFKLNGVEQSHYYVDPATDMLYFKKGHAGRKIKFSTKCKSDQFVKARRFANQEFDRRTGKTKVVARSLIKDELKLWLLVKESEDLAYDTLNNVRRAKKQIEEFWGGQFPSQITRDNLTVWYDWWARNNPDIDMENAIKYMRNFCRYLAEKIVDGRPLLPAVPTIKDPNYKKIRRRRKKAKENIFTSQDFKKILSTADGERDRLIVLIMYTMATRITETLEMRWDREVICSADLHGKWIYRWSDGQNKADLDGWHVFHPAIQEPMSKRCRQDDDFEGRVFPQQFDRSKALREQMIDWAGWRKRAGLDFHWTPHTFRHTCLSNLFNDPANPQALICKLYRVSLAVAMESYVKPTEEGRERMAKAIKVEL